MKQSIFSKTKAELVKEIEEIGLKKFVAKQIWQWIYIKGAKSFDEMTNISKDAREKLSQIFDLSRPIPDKELISSDETRKWLLQFGDKNLVEAVFIPEEKRGTLCISSQIGCTLACKFCHTGTQTLVRNLEVDEIISQVILAKDKISDWNLASNEAKKITNIVFMGMGEPFYNYENVKKAANILLDEDGLNFAAKRVTISTSGLVPEIIKAATEIKTELAISLHSANDEKRTGIMAINKKYPIADLMKACKFYNENNPSQKITFEYVMLKGVNDSKEDAQELVKVVNKYNINAKFNLIPFNPWESCDFVDSGSSKTKEFQAVLKDAGFIAPIRKTRGQDAMAACGQLKSESTRQKKVRR